MSRNVLVVDDHHNVQTLLAEFLSGQGFEVTCASDGIEAFSVLEKQDIDLILLDIMMPSMDGYQFISKLRKESSIPVIMITAKQQENDLIKGFDLGADDYITKPFRMRELLVRMRAVLRRASPKIPQEAILTAGKLVVDKNKHEVLLDNDTVDLTPLEYSLLLTMMESHGQVIWRAALCVRLIENGFSGSEATLKIHVRNLRNKIEADPNQPDYIETVFGVGYRFAKEVL
ncbi:MAG: DNA-binding response regulator [Anaerolineaceae bacterium]|nr:DNA-binding response regulator [Anaerolineaceae bacterium]